MLSAFLSVASFLRKPTMNSWGEFIVAARGK
jgi:hypothetical protein